MFLLFFGVIVGRQILLVRFLSQWPGTSLLERFANRSTGRANLYKKMRKDTCTKPELRAWIHSLVLGRISATKAEELERHISACQACKIEKEFFLICKKLPTDRLQKLTYIRKI